ncbi:hypothetical protein [Bradyrhizobium sp. WD16]|uniref:hypothetical protein n=1 Tax=Bradyrhizobium sp. WD16 TaxID=1521768 RepID=UPI0020A33822|nr:hypothetical protein [Bradyrhizobium sp. WD16]UTD29925.1 hypothetical protein DB459_26450 [Bradyrhizobium sp. WD16]
MKDVLSGWLDEVAPKARIRSRLTAGDVPMSRPWAASTAAMPVPCECGGSLPPIGLKVPPLAPAISGQVKSMPGSITATITRSPRAS